MIGLADITLRLCQLLAFCVLLSYRSLVASREFLRVLYC